LTDRTWPDNQIITPPNWCEVGLRDGNQALPETMSPEQKLAYFQALVKMGFKQIEIGFPSASTRDFDFCRQLIEDDHIPDDVYIQVLVQCREDLIRTTCNAIEGSKNAIIHFYNATNPTQRRVTFGNMSREKNRQQAVDAARLLKRLTADFGTDMQDLVFQYSPESWSDTEIDHSVDVCVAVLDAIEASPEEALILNLPVTVERYLPSEIADQVERFQRMITQTVDRDSMIISMHPHNDCGTAVATVEETLKAGADRVEGVIFGGGERTGNVDLITLAGNMMGRGINPGIDISNLDEAREMFKQTTGMPIHPRHPYSGDLVFTAFSGSHQDNIKKSFDDMDQNPSDRPWQEKQHYLHVDPADLGREYEAIAVNDQSGKAGTAFVLQQTYGMEMPKALQSQVYATAIQPEAEKAGEKLSAEKIWDLFRSEFMKHDCISLKAHQINSNEQGTNFTGTIVVNGQEKVIFGQGSGPVAAFVHALKKSTILEGSFSIGEYEQEIDLRQKDLGSDASAFSFVELQFKGNGSLWGVGYDDNIDTAAIKAVLASINRYQRIEAASE